MFKYKLYGLNCFSIGGLSEIRPLWMRRRTRTVPPVYSSKPLSCKNNSKLVQYNIENKPIHTVDLLLITHTRIHLIIYERRVSLVRRRRVVNLQHRYMCNIVYLFTRSLNKLFTFLMRFWC